MEKSLSKASRIFTVLVILVFTVTGVFSVTTEDASAASKYPAKVTGITATSAGHDAIKVSWKKVSGANGYKVYRSTKKYSGYKLVKTTSSTCWTNSGLTSNKPYYYKVIAYKKIKYKGKYRYYYSRSYSSVTSVKPILGTPSNVQAASSGYNSVTLSWKKATNAKAYCIYRATSKNGSYTYIGTTTETSFTSLKLTTDKTYYYKVRAYNTTGNKRQYSSYSVKVSAKPVLAAPANVTASPNADSITVSWDAVSGASKYYIYRNDGKVYTTTATSYIDTDVNEDTEYSYRVRAYRTAYSEYSAYSSSVKIEKTDFEENGYLNYSKTGSDSDYTKIYIGQSWSTELNAKLNGGTAAEKLLSRNNTGEQEDVYVFDTEDYDNFLIVYVKDSEIIAWQTTGKCFGVYKGTELVQGTQSSEYEDYDEWRGSTGGPYVAEAKVAANNIEIGDIYFGGIYRSTSEWDISCGTDLEGEESLCEHTINALRVMNGESILEHNEYLYGDGATYGQKAWALTMAEAGETTHSMLEVGPLAGKTGTERGTDISTASGGTLVSDEENVLGGAYTGGEFAANGWYLSVGHSQALMNTYDADGTYHETSIMAAAVAKDAAGHTYWAWTAGRFKVDYGKPVITVTSIAENYVILSWTDILTEQGYTGKYVVEFSLYEDFSTVYKRAEWDDPSSYRRTGLTSGTTYYVRVKACPVIDGVTYVSDWSDTISFTTLSEVNEETIEESSEEITGTEDEI